MDTIFIFDLINGLDYAAAPHAKSFRAAACQVGFRTFV
jgi:hypothetical protein